MRYIIYKDIPKYCDKIDKDKKSVVRLGRVRAKLFKYLISSDLKPMKGMLLYWDLLIYSFLLIVVMIFSRNLLLLSYFYRKYGGKEYVNFSTIHNGMVEITFNPRAEFNDFIINCL